nr:uncharacterized protein LOC122271345 [Parasteatoda tepidariorum]
MFNRDLNLPFRILDQEPKIHYFPCDNLLEENMRKMQLVYRQVYQNLERAAEKQKRIRDRHAHLKTYHLGQKVYLYTPTSNQLTGRAFAKKFSGPYRIIEKHSDLNYTIQDVNKPYKKPTKVHTDRIFSCTQRRPDLEIPQMTTTNVPNATISSQTHVLKINDEKCKDASFPYDMEDDGDDYIPYTIYRPKKSLSHKRIDTTESLSQQQSTQNSQSSLVKSHTQQVEGTNDSPISLVDSPAPRYNLRRRPEKNAASIQVNKPEIRTSQKQSSDNNSLSSKILGWAMNSDHSNPDKGILEKVADALSAKLSNDLQTEGDPSINNITLYPQQTRIFYNQSYTNY